MSEINIRELARSLDALETIKVPKKSHRKDQLYQYFVVLDFEATCWSTKIHKNQNNEIIEFSAILLHAETGKIENEFQKYCKPTENPRLSDFCTELTGIQQYTVDNGACLAEVLSEFDGWLDHMQLLHGFVIQPFKHIGDLDERLAAFATWSDWDLGTCLRNECKRKRLTRETYFNHWIDVRKTYLRFYKDQPMGLRGALNSVGLNFVGDEHCGLDDAKNTAYLINKMICDGAVIKLTASI